MFYGDKGLGAHPHPFGHVKISHQKLTIESSGIDFMFHALLTLLNNSSVKSSTRTVLISSQKNTTWHQIKNRFCNCQDAFSYYF